MDDIVVVSTGCGLVTALALGLMVFFWVDRNYWLRSSQRFADHADRLTKELEATESLIRRVIEPEPEPEPAGAPPSSAELQRAARELRSWSKQLS